MTYWHSTRYPNTIGYVSFNSRINSFNQIEAVFNYYAKRASFFSFAEIAFLKYRFFFTQNSNGG